MFESLCPHPPPRSAPSVTTSSLSPPQVPVSLSCSFSSQCPHHSPCLCLQFPPCPGPSVTTLLLVPSLGLRVPILLLISSSGDPYPPLVPSCRCGTSPPKAASSCRGSGVVASPTCPGHQMAARSWRPPPRPCSGQLPAPTYLISALIHFTYFVVFILFHLFCFTYLKLNFVYLFY